MIPHQTYHGPSQVPAPLSAIRPREWAHVVIKTPNPDKLIDWYCTVLNAQVVLKHRIINFISWDESQDRLAILPVEETPSEGRIDHFAVTYASPADLAKNYYRLLELEITPYLAINHGVAASFYYKDPDGNQLETSVDGFGSVDDLNAWLATGDFDENPYGVRIPPEALAEEMAAVPSGERLGPHEAHRTWLAEAMQRRRQANEGEGGAK